MTHRKLWSTFEGFVSLAHEVSAMWLCDFFCYKMFQEPVFLEKFVENIHIFRVEIAPSHHPRLNSSSLVVVKS
jgi:hypothetical protein